MTLKLEVKRPILSFDGENDYVEVSNTVIPPNSLELTVEVWFKLISTGDEVRALVKQGTGTLYGLWVIYTQYNDWLRFQVRGADGTYSTSLKFQGVELDRWYQAIGVKTSSEIRLYVNNELKDSASFDKPVGIDEPTRIGYDPTWNYPSNAFIALVRAYNRALSGSEIQHNYHNPMNPITDGLVLWLQMDEGSGSTVYDRSGNGNHGTIYGASWSDWWWDETGHCVSLRRRIRSNSLEELDGEFVKSYVKPGWMIRLKEDDYVKFMGLVHEVDRRHRGRDVERCGFKAYDYLIKYDRHVVYRLYQTGTKAGEIIKDLASLEDIPINLSGVEDGDALLSPWEIQNQKALDIMKSVARGTNYWLRMKPCLSYLDHDGTDNYTVVEPFIIYDWNEITIEELIYPVKPKANTMYSKFGMIGDVWTDYPATYLDTNGRYDYTWLGVQWYVRKPDGTSVSYGWSMIDYVNQWVQVIRRFTEDREYSVWINGEKKYSATVPEDYITVLEWDPDTATYPERYKRFVLGANAMFGEFMTVKYGYLRIYKDKALTDDEIQHNLNDPMNPVTDGLVLWLNGHRLENNVVPDLSGHGNDGTIYGASQGYEVYPKYVNSFLLEFKPKVIA